MRRILTLIISAFQLFLVCPQQTKAETKSEITDRPHEIRIGWGDQLFETLVWHNPTAFVRTLPETYQKTYHENHRYTQHLWLEYQKRHNYWFGYGAMVDLSGVLWDEVTRNGNASEIARTKACHFYNIVCMPTIRFTYYHHPYVNLYSGLGAGLCINGGTETNLRGHHTDIGWAAYICVLGISANYDRWCWSIDLGGLYAMRDLNTIFMASTRMISLGLGVRF